MDPCLVHICRFQLFVPSLQELFPVRPRSSAMSKADPSSAASSSSAPAPAPLPSPWAAIARQGLINARLEAQRKAALRPASTAHRHAIESILAFLSLSELARANRVSRHWHSAVLHMRPLGVAVAIETALEQCDRQSQVFRHVTGLIS